jgi:site-specific DNA recombinase
MGTAAVGKTRQGPWQPRLRAQRGRPLPPRWAVSARDVPPEDWITLPVPAMVAPEVFAAAPEQRWEPQRHARQSRRGALSVPHGVVQGPPCG